MSDGLVWLCKHLTVGSVFKELARRVRVFNASRLLTLLFVLQPSSAKPTDSSLRRDLSLIALHSLFPVNNI
ncbi:hypothetical protein B0H66DRAFT_539771 [Apodospora peruviana]|uniref:Uncharacterized protein n=1 Tax=Apodospora peruviana TaxID=516989 RepID=A0AAE0IQ09_9PEZI|nr:hypothetical protein B0H66DRAFT_539771 [Apodospora peruviana]